MSENFKTLLEESLSEVVMSPGALVVGEVVEVSRDYVIVNAGLKSDAEIVASEFKNSEGEVAVKVGDKVEVTLEAVEDGTGHTKMSREKALHARAWTEIFKAQENGDILTGVITGKVKGGFTVDVNGLRAFLPGSLVDVRPIKDSAYIEGRELDFKVIKTDQVRNNIVVSRRAIVENELSEEREKLLENLEEGMVIKGVVKNLTDYGAFINLGGIDGLLHITDLAWKRVKHPSEVLTVGEEIEARVLKFDKEQSRVSLGLKQLGEDPWLNLVQRYPKGRRFFGKVTNLTDYGAFVELEEGVEGLVHLSEMDWANKNVHPGKICHIGDEIEVMVLEIDPSRRRVSLGIKQCTANPWEEFSALHKKGDSITGKIRSITDFGIFIGLDSGIDGLIHLSDLSWDVAGTEAVTNYQKGDELTAEILAIDTERERISLGLKQLVEDPFVIYVTEHGKGNIVSATVEQITPKGVVVKLADNVEGFLKISEISRDHIEDANSVLNVSDTIEVKITSIERKDRKIFVSIKAREIDIEDAATLEYSQGSSATTATLGDKLKEQLEKQSTS